VNATFMRRLTHVVLGMAAIVMLTVAARPAR
jgi:hypothetical protein